MTGKKQTVEGNLRSNRGFTLIELIAVLILIGIVSAIAISRSTMTDEVKLLSEVDTLKGHLRFAQYKALNDLPGTRWGINVSGSSYNLVKYDPGSNATNVWLPGESSVTHTFASGVTAAVTGSNPVLFDEWGSPGSNTTSVTMDSKTITITPNTGFIP